MLHAARLPDVYYLAIYEVTCSLREYKNVLYCYTANSESTKEGRMWK